LEKIHAPKNNYLAHHNQLFASQKNVEMNKKNSTSKLQPELHLLRDRKNIFEGDI